MQNFKFVAYLLLGCTDPGGYVKFTPKYIIVGGEGGYHNFVKGSNQIILVTEDHMPNFKIVAYLLLGCTDSGGYVKFTPKYIIVYPPSICTFCLCLSVVLWGWHTLFLCLFPSGLQQIWKVKIKTNLYKKCSPRAPSKPSPFPSLSLFSLLQLFTPPELRKVVCIGVKLQPIFSILKRRSVSRNVSIFLRTNLSIRI